MIENHISDDIMVSVCCLAYNHKKYIRKTLDGFVNQKTNFRYEVLIHDDASTDGTADIIREYEKKYPEIIKPIYQTENQYSKRVRITWKYQFSRVNGKYIAMCEGDDYWCSDTKLQEQFDIMEQNPSVVLCTNKVRAITVSDEDLERTYPSSLHGLSEGIFKSEAFTKMLLSTGAMAYPFQTSSYFIRANIILNILNNKPDFFEIFPVGDAALMLYCSVKGDAYYLDKEYSKYRHNVPGSWSDRMNNKKFVTENYDRDAKAYEAFDKYTGGKFHKLVKKNINTYKMWRIYKTGKIYNLNEAVHYAIYRGKCAVNKIIRICKLK